MKCSENNIRVAIGGFGAIGKRVAKALDDGLANLELTAVSAQDRVKAEAYMEGNFARTYPILPLGELAEIADVVVECCPAEYLAKVAAPVLAHGKTMIVISVGALLANPQLTTLAEQHGGRILVPSGALLGLDAVQSAAVGAIHSVDMVTRKPPHGLNGAPYLAGRGIDVAGISEPVKLFDGSASEAITGFPANLNVAVALGLAGIGPDRTHLEIWADPGVVRNTHTIRVKSDSADLTMTIENIPSEDNPKTGKITPLSIIATLKRLTAPLVIGA